MALVEGKQAAFITVYGPGHEHMRWQLREGTTSVGRLPSNDIVLQSDQVSRHHASITCQAGRTIFQDQGSHNGSWIDGELVTSKTLENHDRVQIGPYTLEFGLAELAPKVDTPTAGSQPADTHVVIERKRVLPVQNDQALDIFETIQTHRILEKPSIGRLTAGPTAFGRLRQRVLEVSVVATDSHTFVEGAFDVILSAVTAEEIYWLRLDKRSLCIELHRNNLDANVRSDLALAVVSRVFQSKVGFNTKDGASSILCVPLIYSDYLLGVIYLSRKEPYTDEEFDILKQLSNFVSDGLQEVEVRQQKFAEHLLMQHHSPVPAAALARRASGGTPSVVRNDAVVVVSSIADFNLKITPTEEMHLMHFLSRYYEQAASVAEQRMGFMTILNGSMLLMVFPVDRAAPSLVVEASFAAAHELRRAVLMINDEMDFGQNYLLKIGLSYGEVIWGAFGSNRVGFSVIGEAVDRAMALEAQASEHEVRFDGPLAQLLGNQERLRQVGDDVFSLMGSPPAVVAEQVR